ncbi:MAG: ankyrin repeat domain-containing protein [Gluconacetobacter diazotrophicus]|nr:ankyrin repeat domain-containing protein [Gluconacetobacter diazotrophicus]
MSDEPPSASPRPGPDADTIAFAGRVFGAVRAGDLEQVGPLLDAGFPPRLRNDKGDSLVMLAAYHGHAALVRRLLNAGADPDMANDRGQTPLAGAAFKGDPEVVGALLDGGAAVDGHGPDGRTALMVAAMFDREDIVRLLLARGADPERRDAANNTARDCALAMGASRTPELLGRG